MCWLIIMSGVSLVMKRKKMCRQMTHLFSLRKERDSNPRYGYPYNGFRDRPDRPLRHLSFFDGAKILLFFVNSYTLLIKICRES